MVTEGAEHGETDTASFTSHLSALKERGATLLVVGDVPETVYRRLCRQMFGADSPTPRHRLLIYVGTTPASIAEKVPAVTSSRDTGLVRAITYVPESRSATVQTVPTHPIETRVESDTLADLGIEIAGTITEFEEYAGGLEPAQLRLGFDSLLPLSEDDPEVLFRFLHLLTTRIRSVNGMAHFHLPIDYDSQRVRLLEPLFDAVIELRTTQDTLQQRWHLRDADLATEWLST